LNIIFMVHYRILEPFFVNSYLNNSHATGSVSINASSDKMQALLFKTDKGAWKRSRTLIRYKIVLLVCYIYFSIENWLILPLSLNILTLMLLWLHWPASFWMDQKPTALLWTVRPPFYFHNHPYRSMKIKITIFENQNASPTRLTM